MTLYECADEADAAYYANGRRGWLYQSQFVPVLYLLVPLAVDRRCDELRMEGEG
jgi:hypothetical protein